LKTTSFRVKHLIYSLAAALLLLPACFAAAQVLDCSHATVVVASQVSTPQAAAIEMLLDESAKRAVMATKFEPATDGSGHPVAWDGVVLVAFQLAG